MRYYDIKIFSPDDKTTPLMEYTSYPKVGNGNQNDPGALNVMLDIYTVNNASQIAAAVVQIWGVSIETISQANNLTPLPPTEPYTIEVYAGFKKGLPLNNPNQSGLILSGRIFQAFGNWQGTDMTLDLVVTTAGAVASLNSNLVFNWPAGTQLSTAITNTLNVAFPGVTVLTNISPNLVLSYSQWGVYQSLPAFAQMIKQITRGTLNSTYPGVDIVTLPDYIFVYDQTMKSNSPMQLAFQDLIGQVTWIGGESGTSSSNVIQFICPMRADITVGTMVKMPKGLLGSTSNPYGAPGAVFTTGASNPQSRQKSIFDGQFFVNSVHHMGDFRQPNGEAWVTVFEAILQPSVAGATAT